MRYAVISTELSELLKPLLNIKDDKEQYKELSSISKSKYGETDFMNFAFAEFLVDNCLEQEGVNFFHKYVNQCNGYISYLLRLSRMLRKRGFNQLGKETLTAELERYEDNEDILFELAHIYTKEKQWDSACEYYKRTSLCERFRVQSLKALYRIYMKIGKIEDFLGFVQQLLKEGQGCPEATLLCAKALAAAGEEDKALDSIVASNAHNESDSFDAHVLRFCTGEEEIAGLVKKFLLRPPVVELETVNYCNAKCLFCPSRKTKRDFVTMSDEDFEALLLVLNAHGCLSVWIDPMLGEPLLDRDIPSRIGKVKALDNVQKVMFTTNFIALQKFNDEEVIDILRNVDRIHISVAPDRETYLKLFGVDRFNTVVSNLNRISKIVRRWKPGTTFRLSGRALCEDFVIDQDLSLVCEEFIDEIEWIHEYFSWGGKVDDVRDILTIHDSDRRGRKVLPCAHAFSLHIAVNGDVFICPCLGLTQDMKIGNWKEQAFEEILMSEKRIHFMRSFTKGSLAKMCTTCTLYTCIDFESYSNLNKEYLKSNFFDSCSMKSELA